MLAFLTIIFGPVKVQFYIYFFMMGLTVLQLWTREKNIFVILNLGLFIYSIAHVLSVFLDGENILFSFSEHSIVYNDIGVTGMILLYFNVICAIFGLYSSMSGKIITPDPLKGPNFRRRTSLISLLLFGCVIFSFLRIDFSQLQGTYVLTGEFSLLFGFVYLLSGVLLYQVFINGNSYFKSAATYYLIIAFVCLFVLGVRQVIVWILLVFFFAHFIRLGSSKIEYDKAIIQRTPWIGVFLYLVLLMVFQYRFNKVYEFNFSIDSLFFPINAETSFTFVSFYHVARDLSVDKHVSLSWLTDYFVMLIPSQIWANKYEFLILDNMQQKHGLTPFGTYFLPSTLLASSRNFLSYLVQVILYATILAFVWRLVVKSRYYLFYAPVFISFAILYPIRGTFHGGIKLFTYFVLLLILMSLGTTSRNRRH